MKCNAHGRFLGYYFSLGAFLAQKPHGIPGNCFVNGETLSLWVWDEINRRWVDSNRPDNWLKGIIDDPNTFIPENKPGIKTAYLYTASESGNITFTHFRNAETALSVEAESAAMIMLFWNGDYWEYTITPLDIDLSLYALKDLSNVDMKKFLRTVLTPNEKQSVETGDGSVYLEMGWNESESWTQLVKGNFALGITGSGKAFVSSNGEKEELLKKTGIGPITASAVSDTTDFSEITL